MSEAGEGRAQGDDPLVLALRAIQAFDLSFSEFGADSQARWQAAQLRTLWALAAEVRALRFVLEGDDDDAQGDA